jgi:MYXO-CTERM domain-containing protein
VSRFVTSVLSLVVAVTAGPAAAASPIRHRTASSCGTRQHLPIANGQTSRIAPATGLRTVFLNRLGGTFRSSSNAGTNSSTGVFNVNNGFPIGANATAVIPPLDNTKYQWSSIVACVKQHYRSYSVRFTESRPNGGDYIEAVVGGNGTEVGFEASDSILGIASADDFCGVTERGIAFSFSVPHDTIPQRNNELCATIAHEIGHLLALEHEQLAIDVMSYVPVSQSASKAFVDEVSTCGVDPRDAPSQCTCPANRAANNTTNSNATLLGLVGARDSETVPPTIDVTAPGDGLELPPEFQVVATATDNAAMSDVTVLIDGLEVGNDGSPDGDVYKIDVRGLAQGEHELTAVAHDAAGNTSTEVVLAITVKLLATGASCTENSACSGGLCAQDGDGGSFCTQACETANDTCPSDFACEAVGTQTVCVPDEGGCGCQSSNPGAFGMLALGLGLALSRRRRRTA